VRVALSRHVERATASSSLETVRRAAPARMGGGNGNGETVGPVSAQTAAAPRATRARKASLDLAAPVLVWHSLAPWATECPRQESNLHPALRRRVLYPLSYEGVWLWSSRVCAEDEPWIKTPAPGGIMK
jgi:hypothetical protein